MNLNKDIKKLDVYFRDNIVGEMVRTKDLQYAFKYDSSWIEKGFSINPLSLPLKQGFFIPQNRNFDGMFGIFADSLPDGWGRLIVDRFLKSKGYDFIDDFKRLMLVGDSGVGALSYKPQIKIRQQADLDNLDYIADKCKRILNEEEIDDMDKMFKLCGSSGGARPKVLAEIDDEKWLIKFPSSIDLKEIGLQEYEFNLCAKKCGIEVPRVKLFKSKKCVGYFGVKRFDIINGKRLHMASVSALLETSHRVPNLDYTTLMKLTQIITKNVVEMKKMYKLMCFNVFAHNRDDHSKNFTFIYYDNLNCWKLSPAYDLTYSNSLNGEHATTVNGNGKNPDLKDLLAVADEFGLDRKWAKDIAFSIKENVYQDLRRWL